MKKSNGVVQADPWLDEQWLDSAIEQAVKEAVLDHKRTGQPIAVWEDGAVKIIPPDEIEWIDIALDTDELE